MDEKFGASAMVLLVVVMILGVVCRVLTGIEEMARMFHPTPYPNLNVLILLGIMIIFLGITIFIMIMIIRFLFSRRGRPVFVVLKKIATYLFRISVILIGVWFGVWMLVIFIAWLFRK